MLDEMLLLRDEHLLDHRRIAEQHQWPRAETKACDRAKLAGAAREKRQLVAAKFEQIADNRPPLGTGRMNRSSHQKPADRNSDVFDLASIHRRAAMQNHIALFLPIVHLDYDSGWRAGRDRMTLAENERRRPDLCDPKAVSV